MNVTVRRTWNAGRSPRLHGCKLADDCQRVKEAESCAQKRREQPQRNNRPAKETNTKTEGKADQDAHQEHAPDRPQTENEQIRKAYSCSSSADDFGKHKQRQGSRACKAVYKADENRSPPGQSAVLRSGVDFILKMQMDVGQPAVSMRVNMQMQEPHAENDDHHSDCELQQIGDSIRNDKAQTKYKHSGDEQRRRMPDTPQRTNRCGMPDRSTFTHNS